MALNFQQVFDKIKEIGLGARARQESLDALRERARNFLVSWADKGVELRDKVERARQSDPNIRCARPLEERLDASTPEPVLQIPVTLLAADGSQILPDRHAALQYSLVNVGAIAIQPGSGKSPEVFTDSSLLFADELYTETGIVTEEAIEHRRDIAERRKLLELAPDYPAPVLALTDGPVELWGAKNGGEDDYRKNLEVHKSILSQLQAQNVTVAGYVDKPGADLVVRTLEIAQFSSADEYQNIRKQHPLRGVTDRWLCNFLPGGHRSAVFGLQSSSRVHYSGDLALHFFYLNVGEGKHPWLVRVEVPMWVAEDSSKLNLLHAALLQQCRVLGARPYPYILHRAHEIAVVTFEEKKQVEQMLELELRRAGSEVEAGSNKQSAKDLSGKTRAK
ncbi:MAG TPA: DNA double-strand break repair nuclease NurA [Anaerolineales bacterium]